MTLAECRAKVTNREYLTWQAWFSDEMNRPSRSDYYLMQIACEVARVLAKDPRKIQQKHFLLEFSEPVELPNVPAVSPAEAHELTWLGIVGVKHG